MKIAALASYGPSLIRFRASLLSAMVRAGHQVIASAPDCSEAAVAELSRLGIGYIPLPLSRRGLNPLADLQYFFRVRRLLAAHQVDLCFFYTIKPVIFGSCAARSLGIKHIYSLITGLGYTFVGRGVVARAIGQVTSALYRAALKRNDWVFFQNPDDRDLFVQRRLVPSEKCSVVNGSGVDLNFYPEVPLPSGPPVFLMVARLLRAKGVIEFLTAAEQLKGRFPQCRFRLVGPAETGPDSISLNEINPFVSRRILEYPGELNDVRPELAACTVYVLPSYREGTPRSVLEAMATGRPVVTTDAPGCRETIRPGENGFLVPVRDASALTEAMSRFVLDPALASRMAKASRTVAVEKYDVHLINAEMLKTMGLSHDSAVVGGRLKAIAQANPV